MTAPATTFDERFEALAVIAYRVAYRLLGQRDEAEEVAQETLARAYARWRRVAEYDEPWVARVASNLAIDISRKRRPTVPIDETHALFPGDLAATVLERYGLVRSLQRLSRRQREVVVLRYLADLPEAEVAAVLKTTVGSVKQHCHRAVARLRHDLVAATSREADDV
jgi:RNA polymerase sigma factor (sigma-70 family)